jgi:FtsP/CotA-like multicopper oxidase with cupredoxin domain
VDTWTYNGRLPGPLLRTQLGDRVVVDFINDLPVPTTIHWHGVEVPATADGSSISQLPIPPGGEYRYEFTALTPGLFWYHPHVDTNEQVERGLYGALLVEDPAEAMLLGITSANEHVLVLDDVLIEDGLIAPPFPSDPLANALTHFNGRIGNVLLANGRDRPTINVRNGVPQRLRLVNVANGRFMRVSFGPGQTVWRVGGDAGLLESPLTIPYIDMVPADHGDHGGHDMGDMAGMTMSNPDLGRGVMLTPGERADLIWVPMGAGGELIELSWHDWPRGDHGVVYADDGSIRITHDPTDGMAPPEVLIDFRLVGDPAPTATSYAPPASLRTISPLSPAGAPIALTMGHGPPGPDGEVTFFMQRDAAGPKPFPALTPADVATAAPGEVRMIEVTNLTMGAHNFHIHGFFFQLIETQYIDLDNPDNNYTEPSPYRENKDTILIPPRPGAPMRSRTVSRLAVSFDETGREGRIDAWGKEPTADRSGGWLMHCHLLEHSNRGMMSFVQVRS